jgi:glycine cleavage system regulatory protein
MDTTFNIIQTKFATVGAYFLIIVHAAGSASAASTMPHFFQHILSVAIVSKNT